MFSTLFGLFVVCDTVCYMAVGILTKESLFSKYGAKVFIPGAGIFLYYKWLNNE